MPKPHKPRRPKKIIVGEYPIDTGTAMIRADPRRDGAYLLEINNVPSSPIVLGAPRLLGFEYMRWIAEAIAPLLDARPLAHLLHLGGAACTLPSFCADKWPASRNTVVEIDQALADLVAWAFDLHPEIMVEIADARATINTWESASVDVLIRDVFVGPDTPLPMRTAEFYAHAARALTPGGLYLANTGDSQGLPTSRRDLAGMLEAFQYVGAIGPEEMLAGRAYGNIVLWGSDKPLSLVLPGVSSRDHAWAQALASVPLRDL